MNKLILAAIVLATSAATANAYIPTDHLVSRFIAHYDQDRNGEISRAEFLARAESRYRELDRNGDGRISAEEASAVIGKANGGGW